MSRNSTATAARRKRGQEKPAKPYPDFPLFPHASGRWAKKIRGKLHYFGRWGNVAAGAVVAVDDIRQSADDAALVYQRRREDLYAGRKPREDSDGLTIRDLCNRFLTAKRTSLTVGKITERTFAEYNRTTDLIVDAFGRQRVVSDLRPDDFEQLYAKLAKKHGMSTLGREITMVRSVFKYAVETDLIDKAIKFGPQFKAPSKKDKRKAKAKTKHANGKWMFEAADIRTMLDAAPPQLRAMILLGINGGLGNTDCASLPMSALDLAGGWLDFPRPKTGAERRIPLWPETVKAIEAAIADRPESSRPPRPHRGRSRLLISPADAACFVG